MTASYDKTISQAQSNETQKLVDAFNNLDTDAKLAWFYLVYKKMGDSITWLFLLLLNQNYHHFC